MPNANGNQWFPAGVYAVIKTIKIQIKDILRDYVSFS